ncbi:exodeoxyribonuclease VII large subunit [Bacillus massilinigeriensis]|uniref:exodeoxyribonuclease VII large subunit n=1 Tax=Bacillus massilionigeriensis TaxID=1805475 RepID=UPI00096B4B09|nr:exodeoxyribonuclease VII large subunit [Bacillus massilionigeriensis]
MENRYLSVTALTKYIKRKFDVDPHLQNVFVKGEISNFKQHSSGHMYFTLKDEKARILAVMFSRYNRTLKFTPENGMKVLIKGDISLFESSGQYQVYIKEMQPDGIGELYLAFEQLKEKLEKEQLFSPQFKKKIPKYPKTIGVITSPTGAAIRDIITTIKRRYPIANILLIPALVQGNQAAPSIVHAIQLANEQEEIDVLIVGRGGGSIEELWAFNEEIVARAIFSSSIPIISAVGHETDVTIADFVADKRAPTPTGAAELAVPHIDELLGKIYTNQTRLMRTMKKKISIQGDRLERLQKSYAFRYPHKLYEQKLEQVDKMKEELIKGTGKLLEQKSEQFIQLEKRLVLKSPNEQVIQYKQKHQVILRNLNRSMSLILSKNIQKYSHVISTLEALNPLKIMSRGYSVVYGEDGKLVKSTEQVNINDRINVKLSDGTIYCEVKDIQGGSKNE